MSGRSSTGSVKEKEKYWRVTNNQIPRNEKVAILPICLGQPSHEGEKLHALLHDLDSRVGKVFVLLTGILYRYSYELADSTLDSYSATKKAYDVADEWIKNNKEILLRFFSKAEIMQWYSILETPEYTKAREELARWLLCSPYVDYTDANEVFAKETDAFLSRVYKQKYEPDTLDNTLTYDQKVLDNCQLHLREESALVVAAYRLLAKQGINAEYFVYTGTCSSIECTVAKFLGDKVKFVHPKFEHAVVPTTVKYWAKEKTMAQVWNVLQRKVEPQLQFFKDLEAVHANGLVFSLRGGSQYLRDGLQEQITAYLATDRPEVELIEAQDKKKKEALLFFMPKGKYSADKFSGSNAKQYVLEGITYSYDGTPVKQIARFSCVINLSEFEKKQLANMHRFYNLLGVDSISLETLCRDIQFTYSILVARRKLPRLCFFVSCYPDNRQIKATFVALDDIEENIKNLQLLFETFSSSICTLDSGREGEELHVLDAKAFQVMLCRILQETNSQLSAHSSNEEASSAATSRNTSPAYTSTDSYLVDGMPCLSLSSGNSGAELPERSDMAGRRVTKWAPRAVLPQNSPSVGSYSSASCFGSNESSPAASRETSPATSPMQKPNACILPQARLHSLQLNSTTDSDMQSGEDGANDTRDFNSHCKM